MGVRRPGWWCYPERCESGHEWGPGLVLVSWERCHCAPARSAYSERAAWGHLTVACRVPGCRSRWYSPRHEPSGGLALSRSCDRAGWLLYCINDPVVAALGSAACPRQHGMQGRPGIGRPIYQRRGGPSHGNNADAIETAGREDPARPYRGRRHAKDPCPPPVHLVTPAGHPTSLPGLTACAVSRPGVSDPART